MPNNRGTRRGNHEGSFRQRKNGTWEGRVPLPSGGHRSFYGKTKADVQRKTQDALKQQADGIALPAKQTRLAAYLDDWLANVIARTTAPRTHASYAELVKNHITPSLGKLALERVDPPAIRRFLNTKSDEGLSPRTVQYLRSVLRSALAQAERDGLVARNAARLVKPPKVTQRKTEGLSAEQARAVLAAFDGHDLQSVVLTLLTLGLRRGEALGLHWRDVDLDGRTVHVRGQYILIAGEWQYHELKTDKSRRTLMLPPFLVDELRRHRAQQAEHRLRLGPTWKDHDLVFPSAYGTPMEGTNLLHRFHRQLAATGLPRMRLHDLRHGAASLLLAKGATLREIMDFLGHSQISLTANLYTHLSDELRNAAADRMETVFGSGTGG